MTLTDGGWGRAMGSSESVSGLATVPSWAAADRALAAAFSARQPAMRAWRP